MSNPNIGPFLAVKIAAPNTSSGNPNRVFVILDSQTGDIAATVDEGYEGRQAVASAGFPRLAWIGEPERPITLEGPTFDGKAAECRQLLRDYPNTMDELVRLELAKAGS